MKKTTNKASELAVSLAAKAWTRPETSGIEMNSKLAIAFAEILDEVISKPIASIRFTKPTDIKSYEDACEYLGKDPGTVSTAGAKLIRIAKAMNKIAKFKADFNNPEQKKWRGFFLIDQNGFGFSDSNYGNRYSYADAGARLFFYFESQEDSDHFHKHFIDLHRAHFYGQKIK